MSDGRGPGIDPRFDPQFQRGYAPDASDKQASRVPATTAPGAATPDAVPVPASAVVDPPRDDARSDGELESWLGDQESDPRSADPWFLGAWSVSVVALALGAFLSLAGIMTENYVGPSSESDRWLQVIGWTVGPALVQGGLLGVVVMLVWTGLRRVRRESVDREDPS